MKAHKLMTALAIAVVLLGAAGPARSSNTYDLNIYGCSAEWFLWSQTAPTFLSTTGGCTGVESAVSGTTYFMATATGCTGFTGVNSDDTVNIRATYNTSNDAIWAVIGTKDPADTSCNGTDPTGSLHYRLQPPSISVSSSNGTTTYSLASQPACPSAWEPRTKPDQFFTQESHGLKSGMLSSSAAWIDRCFVPVGTNPADCQCYNPYGGLVACKPAVDGRTLSYYRVVADPTAFYVNKAVTIRTCSGGDDAGQMCAVDTDCPNGSCPATGTPITNISRMMAAMIFTGQANNWQDLGKGFPNLPIIRCMRHAGAGTHITFYYAAMGDTHGWLPTDVINYQTPAATISDPTTTPSFYSYDTIPTQLDCVNGTWSGAPNGSAIGAIGYTDADRSTSLGANVTMVNYNGVTPNRRNMRNGLYDDFWSVNTLYYDPARYPSGNVVRGIADSLVSYVSDPNVITGLGTGTTAKGNYWATFGEMRYMKYGADQYPALKGTTGPVQSP